MLCVNTRYFSINRLLFLALGLWPYEQSIITRLQLILLYGSLASYMVFQFATFFTTKCNAQLIIEVFSIATSYIVYVINYSAYLFNINNVKQLLELMQHIFDSLKGKSEMAIMDEYGNNGKRFSIFIALLGLGGIIIIIFSPFWIYIVNTIVLGQELRPPWRVRADYISDKEKKLTFVVMYMNITCCIGLFAVIAAGAMNVAYCYLLCGMFKIASYRLEQAMSNDMLKMSRKKYFIRQGIICAINIHREAVRLMNLFMSKMEIFYFYLIAAGVVSSSLNLYRVFQELSSGFNLERLVIPIICLHVFYIYVICANNVAQKIIDHNDYVFLTVYNVQWYKAPLHIQKMILFMLQKGTKSFHILIGGVFMGSLESAAKLMNTSMSYFTVLYSTRQG